VEWVEEPSYFFKLSEFQDRLLAFYEEHPDFIQPPARRNEVLQFVRGGLQDLSISRTSFRWGIPVPGDEKHIMYVWLDALANYLSALGWAENAADFQDFWPADLHMVGKDILRFHAVYWPAFLMSADLPPPLHVFAHGWWTIEGEKMSKSLGNVVAPQELVERYGLDQTRYFLLRGVTFGADGNFSRERMHLMVNADLANTIGNLAQRTLSFVQKHADGVVPDSEEQRKIHEDLQPLLARFQRQEAIEAFYRTGDFSGMLEGIRQFAVACNEFIDAEAPWKLKKENKISEMNAALRALLEAIRKIAIMLQPFMPDTMRRCLVMLGYAEAEARRGIPFSELGDANSFHLQAGAKLGEIAPLFPRLEGEV
jgi:methionyl-tRNA synthetase